jgi:hypothetical protein
MAPKNGQRSLVANAGDLKQLANATEVERQALERRMNGWRFLLSNPVGRELAWSMLADCNVFVSVMAQSPYIFENAGRQAWGLKMMDEMIEADEDLYLQMQKEAMQRKRRVPEPKPSEEGESSDD